MADFLFSEAPIRSLQDALSPFLDGFFIFVTYTGASPFLLLLALVVYWLFNKRAGLFLGIVLLSSSSLNGLLKGYFQMPRPPSELHLTAAAGNGFPSGHAQQASAFWSAVSMQVQRLSVPLAPLFIGLVALSRVYLGVHYVGDVLGGIAFGLAVSFAALAIQRVGFWHHLRLRGKLLLAILLPSLAGSLTLLGVEVYRVWGFLLGISLGYVLEAEYVGLGRHQGPVSVALRLLTGLPPLAALYAASLWLSTPFLLFPLHVGMGLAATLLLPSLFKSLESRLTGRGLMKGVRPPMA